MRAVLTWMIAVLNNQVARAPITGLDARVALARLRRGDHRRPELATRLLDTVNII